MPGWPCWHAHQEKVATTVGSWSERRQGGSNHSRNTETFHQSLHPFIYILIEPAIYIYLSLLGDQRFQMIKAFCLMFDKSFRYLVSDLQFQRLLSIHLYPTQSSNQTIQNQVCGPDPSCEFLPLEVPKNGPIPRSVEADLGDHCLSGQLHPASILLR